MAKKSKRMVEFEELPEPCIATILSHTTPIDTCRLSVVSKTFHSASDSDDVWNRFLPSDSNLIDSIFSRYPHLANPPSKKALFRALSDSDLMIIDDGKKSFQLDKKSGKIFYMLSARSLTTTDCKSSARRKKKWISVRESRFPKVLKLGLVSRLEIHGMISSLSLSPNTEYVAYLVFKMSGGLWIRERACEVIHWC
ncbi:putative F-box protein PP2-B12 [Trifolium pratense]|uniref:putative F-box protein PP2-B12 n=1 Tax=Trifolium pratense TaxID=57577 RepID=UPI001E68FE1A|nr:putative F-box protein PP2-B12 [Trifolium pratense]